MPDEISLFEAIRTQRAIRRFTTEAVTDDVISQILEAAIRAPSGTNKQPWYFLVIRDRETKARIGEFYLDGWTSVFGDLDPATMSQPARTGGELGRNMADVPVLILACMDRGEAGAPAEITTGSSIYPAVQNLMLAARALGLGTVITTLHRHREDDLKRLLGIPAHVETAALIPVGYPADGEHFGGSRRKPVDQVAFYERWGRSRG